MSSAAEDINFLTRVMTDIFGSGAHSTWLQAKTLSMTGLAEESMTVVMKFGKSDWLNGINAMSRASSIVVKEEAAVIIEPKCSFNDELSKAFSAPYPAEQNADLSPIAGLIEVKDGELVLSDQCMPGKKLSEILDPDSVDEIAKIISK